MPQPAQHAIRSQEGWSVLHELEAWLETPMIVLSFGWLMLVVAELVWGGSDLLEIFGTVIWIVFILEFVLRLTIAPDKGAFLKTSWLTIIALIVPAFRMLVVFRALRVVRAFRGLRLVKIVGTANRSMNALRRALGRRGFGYVLATTILVAFLGAAGMLAFEPSATVPGGFRDFWDALWWTAMILTSMGSAFWPTTGEGRLLCLLLSVYGFAVFGYITASFASFFVGQEAKSNESDVASARDIAAVRRELALLRTALQQREKV